MPGEQHVFLAVAAGVTDQRKGQSVSVGSAELVNTRAFTVFRSFAAGALNRNGVPGDCVGAPDIAFTVMVSIDIECAVGPHRPDSAERVSPCAGERGRTGARSSCAGTNERDQGPCENDSEKVLYFHAVHPAWRQLKVKLRWRA